MKFHGLNTMRRNIRSTESPDCRNGIIDTRGIWRTRSGLVRQDGDALGSLIECVTYLKSDDCVNDYIFAMTADGRIIVNPEDYTSIPQPTNLKGLWKFEEASGSIIDGSGNSNHGTYNGALYQQAGKVGYGLGFITDDYVNCGGDSSLDVDDFTIAIWFKTSDVSTWPILIARYHSVVAGYDDQHWDFYIEPTGELGASFSEEGVNWDDGYFIQTNATYDDGEWHLGMVVREGDDWDIYVDGEVITDYAVKDDISGAGDFNFPSTAPVIIGGDLDINDDFYFNGTLDEAAIWDSALTATEILDHYNSQV